MIKYTVYLTKNQVQSLKLRGGTVSEHIRRAIDRYLKIRATLSPSILKAKGVITTPPKMLEDMKKGEKNE